MIHHIVLWKLRESAEGKTKQENAQWIRQELEALKDQIPEIERIEVGIDVGTINGNFDVVLDSYFKDMDALDRYQVHPAHKRVADYIGKVREQRVAVDYECR